MTRGGTGRTACTPLTAAALKFDADAAEDDTGVAATSEAPASLKLAGAGALAAALLLWLRGRRRGYLRWSLPLESTALLVYLVALGNPLRGLGVVYVALYFRSFYGSAASAVALWASWIAVQYGAILIAGGQPFAPAARAHVGRCAPERFPDRRPGAADRLRGRRGSGRP